MMPVSLSLEGLYSYQKKQTIDFSKLTHARLFGIFGPVGCGKSSILEAITFALYGKSERLNGRDNVSYNLLNLKSDVLSIEFVFEAGNPSVKYLATAKTRRNSKQFADVKTIVRALYRDRNGEWEPLHTGDIEQIVGLSYDNFRRTIIIPQGKFQEFLQLGSKDRTQMLKELFNLQKYELYKKAGKLDEKNKERLQNIEGQLLQLGDFDQAKQDELKTILLNKQSELKLQNEALLLLQKQENEQCQLKQASDKYSSVNIELQQLKLKADEIQMLEEQVRKLEYCLIHFKGSIDALESAQKKREVLNIEIGTDLKELELLIARRESAERAISEIAKEYEQRDILLTESDDLERLADAKKYSLEAATLQLRVKNGEKLIADGEGMLDSKREELRQGLIRLDELKQLMPDLAELASISDWHTRSNHMRKNIEIALAERNVLVEKGTEIEKQLKDIVFEMGFSEAREWVTISDVTVGIEELKRGEKTKNAEVEGLISHYQLQMKLKDFSDALTDGKPCPLCGSEHHPNATNFENVTAELENCQKQKSEIEKQIELAEKAAKKLIVLQEKESGRLIGVQQNEKAIEEARVVWLEHEKAFVWDDFRDPEKLKAAFEESGNLKLQIEQLEKELKSAAEVTEKDNAELQRNKDGLGKLHRELVSKQSASEALLSQIKIVQYRKYEGCTAEELANEVLKRREQHRVLAGRYKELETQIQSVSGSEASVKGRIGANRNALSGEIQLIGELEATIASKIQQSEFNNPDEVREILKQNINPDESKNKIKDYNTKLTTLELQKRDLDLNIAGRVYNAEDHLLLKVQLETSLNLQQQLNQEIGRLEGELKQIGEDWAKMRELQKEQAGLRERAEDIKSLMNLFKGSGFVNFVSSAYLSNLCKAANDRFYNMTRQQLSLELTEDNEFRVRDFMNGGNVRSVKTLSGGQTFQAALSLALALADNIRQLQQTDQNFFFLDEGFGTLDRDSLNVVFNTLKSLRSENRVVGVISHVEEMQQEIETYLSIVLDAEQGSIVSPGWK
ncbi:MAG: hypothetical protein CVU11_05120 [Bacteroidetes bacterium HGW-Bacteroidetes-6]|jgi:exonuclease SbcC|nr:MAG: hypothetical protein CVU11_05120 [Bacteroidetes bacterium HGW-Bacteroidetes-6]